MPRGRKLPTSIRGFGYIERRSGSQNWYLVFRPVPGGKRVVRSAQTPDQETAFNKLVKLKAQYATGERLGSSAEHARFSDLFALLEADYRRQKRASTEDMLARVNKHLMPWFGNIRVLDLRKRDVQGFIDSRLEGFRSPRGETETLEPASVNKLLAYMRRALKLGMAEDPPLVLRIPPWFSRIPGERVRSGIIDRDTYDAILTECSPHLKLLCVMAYHTGMRRGAILGLRWEWVDWRENVIVIPPDPDASTKHKPREVPIYGKMRPWLEMAKAERDAKYPDCPWIIAEEGQQIASTKTGWNGACERAGVSGVKFHDFRRTAITNMEAAGIPRHQAMAISGHRTQAVYERYGIASRKGTQAAGRQMETWLEQVDSTEKSERKLRN